MKESDRGKWGALFAEAHRALDILSATRIRRIEEIRAALAAGAYRIDGRLIAEKMVSDVVRELRSRIR